MFIVYFYHKRSTKKIPIKRTIKLPPIERRFTKSFLEEDNDLELNNLEKGEIHKSEVMIQNGHLPISQIDDNVVGEKFNLENGQIHNQPENDENNEKIIDVETNDVENEEISPAENTSDTIKLINE